MRKSSRISVCLADDHTVLRKALVNLVKTFQRVGEVRDAANGEELLILVQESPPDVVMVDLHMPVMDGEEVCIELEKKFPEVKIIILTMEDDEEYVNRLIGLGAHAYLSKEATTDEVESAIYAVFDHDFYSNDLVNRALRNQVVKPRQSVKLPLTISYTKREQEIIQLICDEYTMSEIADRLNRSEKTIQNHRSFIQKKMNVRNTAGLVKYAILHNLVNTKKENSLSDNY